MYKVIILVFLLFSCTANPGPCPCNWLGPCGPCIDSERGWQ